MRLKPLIWTAFGLLLVFFSLTGNAWADDSFQFTRATYDLIMRWVNFTILAVLIVKFARRPIISFLKDKRKEVAESIDRLEKEKRQAESRIREIEIELQAGKERLTLIKERIVADGQRQKERQIDAAKQQSRILLASASQKIDAHIRERKEKLRSEMVDAATEIALKKLPRRMTSEDHERLLQTWIRSVQP